MKNITTLEQLRDYINEHDDWKLEVSDIIEKNGWVDETGEDYGICSDGKRCLLFDDEMNADIRTI